METWVWLSAYLVGFVVLQVLLYRYFVSRSASRSGTTPAESGTGTAGLSRTGASVDVDHEQTSHAGVESLPESGLPDNLDADDAIRCENCGAYNERDSMFSYCRNCGSRL